MRARSFGSGTILSITTSLAWLLRHPAGIFPVIGTTQPERILESARAVDVKLDAQDWFEMLKVASGRDVP